MRVRVNRKSEMYLPNIGQIDSGTPFRFKQGSAIAIKISEGSSAVEDQSSYAYLRSGEHYRSQDKTLVYPCDGEFVEAGAEESKIQVKNCTVHNIHNESGDAFRKSNPQGIRRESGTMSGSGKYEMSSIAESPEFKKRLDELVKANDIAKGKLKSAGIVIDEKAKFEESDSYVSESGDALDKVIDKIWDEAKEADKEAAMVMAKEHIDKKVRFTGTIEEWHKAMMDENPEYMIAYLAGKVADTTPPDKPTGNPHWCQFCGRIHCPEPGIIPGNPKKAYKPIKCPAGIAWDDTPYTGIHSSSCLFWVPSDLHAGDYRCPKCHAVMIEMAPNELDTNSLCPTCDVAAGFIDMSKIHDESDPFEPPEPYIEKEPKEPAPGLPEKDQPFNLEALLSTLLPCPECKSIKVLELRAEGGKDGLEAIQVFCQMCAFVGPSGKTEKEAINLWNEIDRSED